MESVSLRWAGPSDLEAIARIETESYSNPWHPDSFGSLLRRDRARLLVAEVPAGGVVGFAVFWWVMDQAELANLAVENGYRGRGIGGALLDRVLAEAAAVGAGTIFLEVRVSNDDARRLYTGRGFTRISIRRGYYQNPKEDAWILARALESPASITRSEGGMEMGGAPETPEISG